MKYYNMVALLHKVLEKKDDDKIEIVQTKDKHWKIVPSKPRRIV